MENSALKLSFALVLVIVGRTFTSAPTYQWAVEESGEEVTCQQCPPGTYVARHCTSTSKTDCKPCPDQHYTSYWNYVEKCRFCNLICADREQVKHECNATQNTVCECKAGYRQGSHSCVRDCSKLSTIDDPECDTEVIEFVVSQNISHHSFQKLQKAVNAVEGSKKKKIRIRSLLKQIKNLDPDHALLPKLMELVKGANLTHLARELNERFITHVENRNIQPNQQ
ncbi:tumor necrosis factor receptor superfamily member 6B [Mantella aurantiaca]